MSATSESAALPPGKRDGLPLWVILLLVLFLGLRVSELGFLPALGHGSHRLSQNVSGQVDDKTMEALLASNYSAKASFLMSAATPGAVKPAPQFLQDALDSAETLQKSSGNAPGAARRVLVLRALLHLSPLGSGKKGIDPSLAYQPPALAALPPTERARYAQEGKVWSSVFSGKALPPEQVSADAAQIRALPNLRWWLYPSLTALYQAQNNPALAQSFARQARDRAVATLLPLTLMLLFWLGLGLLGVGLLVYFAARAIQGQNSPSEGTALADFWPTVPELVPLNQRRLRAGDLMGIFVLYLLMPDILGYLLSGFGFHRLHLPGLLSPYKARLTALPAGQYDAFMVVLEFFAYLISALIPIGLLLLLARRRGASIASELGWNVRRLGQNLLYGFAGYGVGLPLVLLAGLFGHRFIHAPTPSNPAIPLLADASSLWVQLLLVALATIAAPLTEEFLFRGVFYNAAKLRLGVWPAIVLTGVIFGFVHPVGIAEMLPLAMLGGVFAWMAETRKSLVPSMVGHCLQNLMATLYLLLVLAG